MIVRLFYLIIRCGWEILGIAFSIATIAATVFNSNELLQLLAEARSYIVITVIALILIWFKELRSISSSLVESDVKITIKFGSIFNKRSNIFVPFNSQFRTVFPYGDSISEKSIHGQVIKRVYKGDPNRLEAQLISLCQKQYPENKQKKFPPGFTIVDIVQKQFYYFVVTAKIDEKAVSNTTEEMIIQALENFWNYLDTSASNDLPISIPLIGCGQGRLTIKQEQIVRDIIQSFIVHIRRTNTSAVKELIVHIPFYSLIDGKIDLFSLKQFLGYICSEPGPNKNFYSRGLEA